MCMYFIKNILNKPGVSIWSIFKMANQIYMTMTIIIIVFIGDGVPYEKNLSWCFNQRSSMHSDFLCDSLWFQIFLHPSLIELQTVLWICLFVYMSQVFTDLFFSRNFLFVFIWTECKESFVQSFLNQLSLQHFFPPLCSVRVFEMFS